MTSFKCRGQKSNCCTRLLALAFTLVLAAGSSAATIQFHSPRLDVTGDYTPELAGDIQAWLKQRDVFIGSMLKKFPAIEPHLPLVYKLDADFVTAARTRNSVEAVDDCGDRTLCGVATNELPYAWDLADTRALFHLTNEKAAALLGTYEGQDIDQLAADIRRAGVESSTDPRVVIALAASHKGVAPIRPSATSNWPPIKGATLSIVNRLELHLIANGSRAEIRRLHAACYDAITLIPFAGQRGIEATEIARFDQHPAGETDLSILLGAARAHAAGMRVMIKPQIWVRGSGDTTHIEPADWPRWFAAYEPFLIHNALLARAAKADWLVIGTELTRSEGRPEWRRMIAIARALFPGRITYAANFDAFERTPFWDALDAIGIDAYFPLSDDPNAGDRALRDGATAVVSRVDALAQKFGKPVLFTELGYPSRPAAWMTPWTEDRGSAADDRAQTRAFDAMLRALGRSRSIRGFVIWKYETAARAGNRYRPNAEAERVICR
jgi:glycosyl hydrolase family 113